MKTIENRNNQIGVYISRLYTPYYTSDPGVIRARDWVNETIDRFRRKPATVENCQILKDFIYGQMCKMLERPQSAAKSELVRQCLAKIESLNSFNTKAV